MGGEDPNRCCQRVVDKSGGGVFGKQKAEVKFVQHGKRCCPLSHLARVHMKVAQAADTSDEMADCGSSM
jgi:hypothetical protein